jgi:hypothetical protein
MGMVGRRAGEVMSGELILGKVYRMDMADTQKDVKLLDVMPILGRH